MMNKKLLTLAMLCITVITTPAANYMQRINQWVDNNPKTALGVGLGAGFAAAPTFSFLKTYATPDRLKTVISSMPFAQEWSMKCKQWITNNPKTSFALGAAGLFAGSEFLANYGLKRAILSGNTADEKADTTKKALLRMFPESELPAIQHDPIRRNQANTRLNRAWNTAIQQYNSSNNLMNGHFDVYPNKTLNALAQTMEGLGLNTLAANLQDKFINLITSPAVAPEYSTDEASLINYFDGRCDRPTPQNINDVNKTHAIHKLFKIYFIPGILQFIDPNNPEIEPEKRALATQIFNNIYTTALRQYQSPNSHFTHHMDYAIEQFAKAYNISLDPSLISGLTQTDNSLLFRRALSSLYHRLDKEYYAGKEGIISPEREHVIGILDQAALDADHDHNTDRASMLDKLKRTISAYNRPSSWSIHHEISKAIDIALTLAENSNDTINMIAQSLRGETYPEVSLELCKFINIVYAPDYPELLEQLFSQLQDNLQRAFDDSLQDKNYAERERTTRYEDAFNRVWKVFGALKYANTHPEKASELYHQFLLLTTANSTPTLLQETVNSLKQKLNAITETLELRLFQCLAHITLDKDTSIDTNKPIIADLAKTITAKTLPTRTPNHAACSSSSRQGDDDE